MASRFVFSCMTLVLFALSSCGFHLQGHAPTNLQLQDLPPLNIIVREQDPRVKRTIDQQLLGGGYRQSALGERIVIKGLRFATRDISLTTRRQATEKELIATLRYTHSDTEHQISSSRVYTEDPNAMLSSEKQRKALEQQLIEELSQRMFAQLTTALIKPS